MVVPARYRYEQVFDLKSLAIFSVCITLIILTFVYQVKILRLSEETWGAVGDFRYNDWIQQRNANNQSRKFLLFLPLLRWILFQRGHIFESDGNHHDDKAWNSSSHCARFNKDTGFSVAIDKPNADAMKRRGNDYLLFLKERIIYTQHETQGLEKSMVYKNREKHLLRLVKFARNWIFVTICEIRGKRASCRARNTHYSACFYGRGARTTIASAISFWGARNWVSLCTRWELASKSFLSSTCVELRRRRNNCFRKMTLPKTIWLPLLQAIIFHSYSSCDVTLYACGWNLFTYSEKY